MRFLVDVNASGAVAQWLAEGGHDVLEVAGTDPKMSGAAVLDWAVREGRIVVTTDQDFEEMIWREGRSHKISRRGLPASAGRGMRAASQADPLLGIPEHLCYHFLALFQYE